MPVWCAGSCMFGNTHNCPTPYHLQQYTQKLQQLPEQWRSQELTESCWWDQSSLLHHWQCVNVILWYPRITWWRPRATWEDCIDPPVTRVSSELSCSVSRRGERAECGTSDRVATLRDSTTHFRQTEFLAMIFNIQYPFISPIKPDINELFWRHLPVLWNF